MSSISFDEKQQIRELLIRAVGNMNYDIYELARQAYDMIQGDRLTIKILSRNIESLTMQMKEITQVTFERDQLKEQLERQMDINNHLRERLAKYE